jgi:hypothetical protein
LDGLWAWSGCEQFWASINAWLETMLILVAWKVGDYQASAHMNIKARGLLTLPSKVSPDQKGLKLNDCFLILVVACKDF